jgi:ribonuclease E
MVLTRRQSHRRGNDEDRLTELPLDSSSHKKAPNKTKKNHGEAQILSEEDQSEQADEVANEGLNGNTLKKLDENELEEEVEDDDDAEDDEEGDEEPVDEEDEDDDDDINALLDKAEEALRVNSDDQKSR